MQKGEIDNCSSCQFNHAQKNVPAYCDIHMVPLKFPRWTSCSHFVSHSEPAPESPPAPQGQIFRAGLYEEKLMPLRPIDAPNHDYVRIPWYGKAEPKIYVTGNCNECKKNFSSGIEIATEKEILKFCGNRHYMQWWKNKNPQVFLSWEYSWDSPEDPIPFAEKILPDKKESLTLLPAPSDKKDSTAIIEELIDSLTKHASEEFLEEEPLVVGIANEILKSARDHQSSEIHVEAYEEEVRVRMKWDGMLHEVFHYPISCYKMLSDLLKIIGNLDIAERRLPQNNHFQWKDHSNTIHTFPTLNGELIWIQLLPQTSPVFSLNQLGFRTQQLDIYQQILLEKRGLILHAGPLGCGKKTTIFALLEEVEHSSCSILTVEETLKRKLKKGIYQSIANSRLNEKSLAYAACEQRPDILYLEQLFDLELVELLLKFPASGGLAFSSLHVFSSLGVISRLLELKMEPFLIASHLKLIVAQRLLRKLCTHCRQPCALTEIQKKNFPEPLAQDTRPVYRAVGCAECQRTGYQGFVCVYELLPISPKLQQLILKESLSTPLYHAAQEDGFQPLWIEALWKVLEGITSFEEVLHKIPKDPF